MTAPSGALTWASTKERNRVLKLWRHAVFAVFAEQPRAIRIASVLVDLFNVKKGYCFATNAYLAQETSIAVNKLRATLLILENGGAIIRANVTNPATGQVQRVIYPATAIIPRPALGQGGSPTLGQRGEPQQPGHQNLRRIPRIQSSQIALAKADSVRRERTRHGECGSASPLEPASAAMVGPEDGHPTSEATGDDPRLSSTAPGARAKGIERAVGNRPWGASGGIALDRADDPDGRKQTLEDGRRANGRCSALASRPRSRTSTRTRGRQAPGPRSEAR
jgi:hypothetical protein